VPVDAAALARVVHDASRRWTSAAADIDTYLAAQVSDDSHREVVGPLLAASGSSGVVRVGGQEVAAWGDPRTPEMAFSVTKSVLSVVAGLAFDDGLLVPDQPVHEVVEAAELAGEHDELITWRHLLQQTSQWEGELWGKPTSADAQSFREGTETHGTPPGEGWPYNDVRMNLLAYALTLLLRRSLADVLRERVMTPLGACDRWSWHGYRSSTVVLDGRRVEVVSGGAHWGGGLLVPARDLALIGQLFLDRGHARRGPPAQRGVDLGGGRHLLWVDPARELVLAFYWTEGPLELVRQVTGTVTPASSAGPR
jgi:CubicO group peptidase (beta-lactamase class C family)